MDSSALITRKRQKNCCDLLALVKSWHKKLCHFLRVQPIFLSVDYNAVSFADAILSMGFQQWFMNRTASLIGMSGSTTVGPQTEKND